MFKINCDPCKNFINLVDTLNACNYLTHVPHASHQPIQPTQFNFKVIKHGLKSGTDINFYVYDLLYVMHKNYPIPNTLHEFLGTYEWNSMRLLKKPEVVILFFGKSAIPTLKVLKNKSISWEISDCYGVRSIN